MQSTVTRRIKVYRIIAQIICALLIVLWFYTGLNKALDFSKFRFELGRSPFLHNISEFVALAIPFGEMLIAILLIIRRTRLLGLYFSFFLMSLFTGYIYIMLFYSFDLPCSCGGVLASLSWEDHLIFNAVFTILAGIGVILQSRMDKNVYSVFSVSPSI